MKYLVPYFAFQTLFNKDEIVKSRQTALFLNLQSMNSCTYEQKSGEF